MNNVVLGDLSKYRGDDCLKFDGADSVTWGVPSEITYMYCEFIPSDLSIQGGHIIGAELGAKFSHYVVTDEISFLSSFDGSAWDYNTQFFVDVVEGVNVIEMIYNDNTLTININGQSKVVSGIPNAPKSNQIMTIGSRNGTVNFFTGIYHKVKYNEYNYIQNGDFGSTTLVDHSGNGNDGTINGAQWWKKDVDENYLTPQAYKSSWIIPMEQSQNVIYTDAEPYYPTDDVFWNDYNIDPTYDFIVNKQSDGGTGELGYGFTTYTYSYSY